MQIDRTRLGADQKNNLEHTLEAYRQKNPVSGPSPVVLFVELTQNCIAKCAFCHGSAWKNCPGYNMSPELLEIVFRDYIPHAALVDLRGRGESLMLPDLARIVRRVSEYGPKIRLITTLGCGTRETLQTLIDHDVFVGISFDAADKTVYEATRAGVKYDTVIRNLEFLCARTLEKHGSLKDRIRLDISPLQKSNVRLLDGILRLAERLKIQDILIGPMVDSRTSPTHLCNHKLDTLRAFGRCARLARKTGTCFYLTKPPFEEFRVDGKIFDRCCHPWFHAQITYTGELIFCDHLLGDAFAYCSLGNIRSPKASVWNGERTQALRRAHIARDPKELLAACAECYREGRYAEFEQDLDPEFSKWVFSGESFRSSLEKISRGKRLRMLASDLTYSFKGFLRERAPALHNLASNLKRRIRP